MDYKSWFWLPCLLTLAVILSSLLLLRRLLTKKGIGNEQNAGIAEKAIVNEQTTGIAENTYTAAAAGGEFEVFLSFSGKDTRYGFTDYLYNDLEEARIRTFRDNEELRVGEEIGPLLLKAINDSKISIPIFSKNYASSKWCLRELAQMVECKKIKGHEIFPIFYDVQPSDVRHQTGSYEEAFRNHNKHLDDNIVKGWKEALREVGQLKGWELQKETNGHQGKLVKIVVERVLLQLKKNYMDVTENLVGIDHHLEVMMGLFNVDSSGVWIVGIHGMGGIGKTTIAKVIYNQLSEHFERCCFLSDVRETLQSPKGLVNLQNQLISKILKGKSLHIVNVDEGINMIKETVYGKKVLIVLDDVDKKSQVDKLVGKCHWFGSGSRIIVTTRNKEVLNVLNVDKAYETPYMEPYHSLQLFSRHAFRKDFPPEDYDILSREITLIAAGLPLALEVIGSFLYGKRKAVWEDTLIKLKKIPNEELQEKLRISYDCLDHEQRQIFLDIACHFIGKKLVDPFYMWDDCKFYPTNGVNELILRSLVQIGDNNVLRMHGQLRDLGREIVRKENSKEPGERSRLWHHEEAMDIFERHMGTKMVETLYIDARQIGSHELCFTDEEFRQLPNLRLLRLDKVNLTGDFKHLFSKLRWLQWWRCPRNFSPTNFHLKNLVILDLSLSRIKDDWEGWSQIKEAKKLKALYLTGCNGLTRTPDFSTFATLERLILSRCENLVQIDQSISNLINLRVLDIKYSGITKLPDAIGNLEELEEIDASFCSNFQGEIPSSIGRLSSLRILRLDHTKICSLPTSICALSRLQTLDLMGCIDLQSLPELPPVLTSLRVTCKLMETFPSLSKLMNLKELSFFECLNLVEIPGDIGKLSKLEALTFYNTNITSLPAEVGALSHLKELKVQFCDNLQHIQGIRSSLFTLHPDGCKTVERLPDLSNLKTLVKLVLCSNLVEIRGLGNLEFLTSLDVSGCKSLERLLDLSNLKKLKELTTVDCKKLIEIRGLDRLKSLEILDISCCTSLERLPDLSNLGMLKELIVRECKKLVEVEGLGAMKSLESLDMSCCTSLERLPDLSNLGMLKELLLRECNRLVEVEGLGVLKSLERLDMTFCTSLERFPHQPNLGMLKELIIRDCKKLVEVKDLGGLKSLERLYMSCCTSLERFPDLSNLGMLKMVKVASCEKLVEVEGLEVLKSLETLDFLCCTSLERLPNLSNLGMLKILKVSHCEKLVEVKGLGVLKSLEALDMSYCTSLERLPDLSNLGMLKVLRLNCTKLAEVEGLGVLKSLKTLDLSWCTSLKRLPHLSTFGMLKVLRLARCQKLAEVEGLEVLKSLERLDVSWCKSFERLPDIANLGMLRELSLYGDDKLAEVKDLGVLKSLETLNLVWCESLERLPDVSNFGMLKELQLINCWKLVVVEGLGALKSLKELKISRCISLERLTDMSNLKNLKELRIHKLDSLTEIWGLEELESVELFEIFRCKLIEKLPDLSNLKKLRTLRIVSCEKLTEIRGLEELKSLSMLRISGCDSIEKIPDLPNTKIV